MLLHSPILKVDTQVQTHASLLVIINDIKTLITFYCYSMANDAAASAIVVRSKHVVFDDIIGRGVLENYLLPIELDDGTLDPCDTWSDRKGSHPKFRCTLHCLLSAMCETCICGDSIVRRKGAAGQFYACAKEYFFHAHCATMSTKLCSQYAYHTTDYKPPARQRLEFTQVPTTEHDKILCGL